MAITEKMVAALTAEVSALKFLVETVQKKADANERKIESHERILISGDGDRLPLAEIVRTLTRTVSEYIEQKDKEEQVRRDDNKKIRLIVLGFAIPAFITFIIQGIIFFFKIYPILEALN